MSIRGRLAFLLVVLLCALVRSAPAYAQDDSAAAQALWDEAKALAQQGDYQGACPKFAESHALDPQLGTLMNLADCYARVGKVASAWARFVEASEVAAARGDRREEEARRRAAELEPKLTKLRVVVRDPVDGLALTRDGEAIGQALWGSEVPVDPGDVTLRAEAPGYAPWEKSVAVTAEGEVVEVEVPPLEPADTPEPGEVLVDQPSGTPFMVLGIAIAGVGVVGLVVGAVLAGMAKSRDDDSLGNCLPDDPLLCSPEGIDLRDQAHDLQTGAIVGFVAGGLLGVTGALLIVIGVSVDGGDEEVALAPLLGPDGAGLSLSARW